MDYSNRFDFMKHRKIFFGVSLAIIIIGLIIILVKGMNFGVDFKAGTFLDINTGKPVTAAQAEQLFANSGIANKPIITIGGTGNDRVSARFDDILSQDTIKKKVESTYTAALGNQVSYEVNTVSPDIAKEMGLKAMYAVAIASIAICIYVSIRFEWRIAVASIIAILHDALMVICMFAIFRFEVTLPFVAAVLTTIGYSINDKIVIFDRIRENMRFTKIKSSDDLSRMINASIWQTMARNINTVLTVLIAAGCLFIFGSQSIKLFALAKLIGLTSGAYSSLCIASPLWYLLKKNKSVGSKTRAAAVKE